MDYNDDIVGCLDYDVIYDIVQLLVDMDIDRGNCEHILDDVTSYVASLKVEPGVEMILKGPAVKRDEIIRNAKELLRDKKQREEYERI